MLKIGITGGIGSGKSTVSTLLTFFDIPVYTADDESKKLCDSSPSIRSKLIALFGEQLYKGSSLDRKLLASLIFDNDKNRELVNNIIHPEVRIHLDNWLKEHSQYPIIAEESAILFETKMNKFVDKTISVYTPIDIRIQRVMKRDGSTYQQVSDRINAQMNDEEKIKRADFVIINDETKSIIAQTNNILAQLKSENI